MGRKKKIDSDKKPTVKTKKPAAKKPSPRTKKAAKKKRKTKTKRVKKVSPWLAMAAELEGKPRVECKFCSVEQYLSVFPERRNNGFPVKLGHYYNTIMRNRLVPEFARCNWVVSAHVLCDWGLDEAEKYPYDYIERCVNHLNYCSLVSLKTGRVNPKPKNGILGITPLYFKFLDDVYGEGKGFVAIFTINERLNRSFWGEGVNSSQAAHLELRGRPPA